MCQTQFETVDESTGETSTTVVAPKISNNLTLFQPGEEGVQILSTIEEVAPKVF